MCNKDILNKMSVSLKNNSLYMRAVMFLMKYDPICGIIVHSDNGVSDNGDSDNGGLVIGIPDNGSPDSGVPDNDRSLSKITTVCK